MAVMGNTEIAKFFSLKLLAQMNSNYAGMTNGCVLYKITYSNADLIFSCPVWLSWE
jgi:hypothetical protein